MSRLPDPWSKSIKKQTGPLCACGHLAGNHWRLTYRQAAGVKHRAAVLEYGIEGPGRCPGCSCRELRTEAPF